MSRNGKIAVVVGNPFDGLQVHGPFSSFEEAEGYVGYDLTPDDEYNIVSMHDMRGQEVAE